VSSTATNIRGVSRRDMLRNIALALTAAGAGPMSLEAAQHVHNATSAERAKTGGAYQPKLLNAHEYKTVTRLAELIIPADEVSGSAVDAGAPEFIDLLCSQNAALAGIYTGGLLWLDGYTRNRYGNQFLESTATQQNEVMDALVAAARTEDAWRREAENWATEHYRTFAGEGVQPPADMYPGLNFFNWVLRMTVDAFYTSPIGVKDVGFMGNAAHSSYVVPQEAIDYALKRSPLAKG
jgi:gluconate 2-dehydrogenase gamma chain